MVCVGVMVRGWCGEGVVSGVCIWLCIRHSFSGVV